MVNFNLEIKNVFWILFHCTESLSFVYTVYIKVTIVCLQCCLKMYVNINMSNTNSGFPCGSAGKESTCSEGDLGSILGWKDPLEKGEATHSSILAWRIPWTV